MIFGRRKIGFSDHFGFLGEIFWKYIEYNYVLIVFSGYSKLTVPNTMMCAGYKEGEKIHARLDGELCSIRIDKNKELT